MKNIVLRLNTILPGVFVSGVVAMAAMFLSDHYGAPTTLFALLLGLALHFMSDNAKAADGIDFSARHLLRIGIALMGLRISFSEILGLGWHPLAIIILLVAITILVGLVASRVLQLGASLGVLTGGAVAICGASAALAISSVLPKTPDSERNTLITIVSVTALSTVAMVTYPIIFSSLGLSELQQGILIGATIHDVAQVVGAGFGISEEAGKFATVIKLFRVTLLPLVVICIAVAWRSKNASSARESFPLFLIGFTALMIANTVGLIPEFMRSGGEALSRFLLIAAISALGIKTSLQSLFNVGQRHLVLVAAETVLLLGAALLFQHFGLL